MFLLLLSVRRSQLVHTMASNSGVLGAKISVDITKEAVVIVIDAIPASVLFV